jgi:hypothetical protein
MHCIHKFSVLLFRGPIPTTALDRRMSPWRNGRGSVLFSMNEHTYPMPEVESQKLDELREHLPESRTWEHARDWMIHHSAALSGAALATGVLVWFALRKGKLIR